MKMPMSVQLLHLQVCHLYPSMWVEKIFAFKPSNISINNTCFKQGHDSGISDCDWQANNRLWHWHKTATDVVYQQTLACYSIMSNTISIYRRRCSISSTLEKLCAPCVSTMGGFRYSAECRWPVCKTQKADVNIKISPSRDSQCCDRNNYRKFT